MFVILAGNIFSGGVRAYGDQNGSPFYTEEGAKMFADKAFEKVAHKVVELGNSPAVSFDDIFNEGDEDFDPDNLDEPYEGEDDTDFDFDEADNYGYEEDEDFDEEESDEDVEESVPSSR